MTDGVWVEWRTLCRRTFCRGHFVERTFRRRTFCRTDISSDRDLINIINSVNHFTLLTDRRMAISLVLCIISHYIVYI